MEMNTYNTLLVDKKTILGLFSLAIAYCLKLFLIILAFSFSLKNPLIHGFLLEITAFCTALFFIPNRWFRCLFIPLIILTSLQLVNVFATGNLLDPLTLLNLQTASSLPCQYRLKLTAFFIFILLSFLPDFILKIQMIQLKNVIRNCAVFLLRAFAVAKRVGKKHIAYSLLLVLLCICEFCNFSLPLASFGAACKSAYKTMRFKPTYRDDGTFFSNEIKGSNAGKKYKTVGKNIIVIFTEGLSAEVCSEELTPNIMKFKKKSLDFSNYYNHTAATYRGIRGSLISGFMRRGGFDGSRNGIGQIAGHNVVKKYTNNVESVPHILNRFGYHTVFLSPHAPQKDNFDLFLKTIFLKSKSLTAMVL